MACSFGDDFGVEYMVDGITGERKLAAIYDLDFKRFIPTDGIYWTDDIVKKLKGD